MESQIPFSLIVGGLLFFVFVIVKSFKAQRTNPQSPPGPWQLPIIGNLHQLSGELPHHAFTKLSKKYGPIFQVKLGKIPTIVVSSPELAKEVLTTNDIALAQRPKTLAMGIVLYGCTDVAVSEYGDYWRQMKKVCTLELLSAKKVRSFSNIRAQETSRLIDTIRSSCGSPINFTQLNVENTNSVICRATFGDKCKDQATLLELIEKLLHLADGFDLADLYPDLKFLHILSGKKSTLLKMHEKLDKLFNDIFEEHKLKRSSHAHDEEDLVDVLFRIKDKLEYPISFDNIKAVLMDMFIAGTDTSSATKDWAMTELMRNPKSMKKAQGEVREAFKGKTTITEADLQGLPYLRMVVKETLRLHPTGTLLPRECRQPCKIGGYDVPVKTRVFVNAWACTRDPRYWEDAESFIPERFENTNVDFMGTDYEFLAFGAGRRMCPGINFGLVSIEFPLAQLLYHFDWSLPDGMKPEDIDVTESNGVTTTKKVPLLLIPTTYSPA